MRRKAIPCGRIRSTHPVASVAGTLAAVAGLVVLAGGVGAQTDSTEHESHHPGGPPGASSRPQPGEPPMAGGGMGNMDAMMERMGVPPPRELYPEMMRLEDLSEDHERELLERAARRRADGAERLARGIEALDTATREGDRADLSEAVAEARAGLDELESGLATSQALAAGREPREIALGWFRGEMGLTGAGAERVSGPLGLTWFHLFAMAFVTTLAAGMLAMHVHRMRRAAALLGELAHQPAETPDPAPPSENADSGAARSPAPVRRATGPANSAAAFEQLRKTGACGGCKNPCSTRMRVAGIFGETPDVKTFRLTAVDGGPLPFDYLPGQFMNVLVPAHGEAAPLVKRSYTIASSPTQGAYCEISVKREPEGVVSRHLHDALAAGDELRIAAPYGRFTFTGEEDPSIVLIACGIGITPLMSVIRYLTDSGWGGKITLFFGFRTPADFVFREELERLSRRHPNLRVVATASKPEGTDWRGRTGRIGSDLVREVLPDIASRRVHLCGPKAMMDATRDFLLELGVARERIRFESFGPVAPLPPPIALREVSPANAPSVTFARSKKSAPLPAGRTILDAAESVDVEIEWSCRSGTCGSCTVKLLSGEVTMEIDDGLDDEDRAAGLVLACQARATADLEVDA